MHSVNPRIKFKEPEMIEWWYVLLFIMYIPAFVTRIVNIPYWGMICGAIILISDIYFVIVKRRLTSPVIWTTLLYGYFVLVTIVCNIEDIRSCLHRAFTAVSFVLTLEYLFEKYSVKKVIDILMKSMELFNYANLLSMMLYPAGMYKVIIRGIYEEIIKVGAGEVRSSARVLWLLGHQTLMSRFTLPAICIALLYVGLNIGQKKAKLRCIALIAVCMVEIVIANSAGNYILLFLFILFMCLFHFRGKIRTWMVYPLIVASYMFFLTQSTNLKIFTFFSNMLNRRVHLSTRVPIWINTLRAWLERPLFGWGYINENSVTIRQMLSLGNPHSSYLWALFEGGIVGIILLIFFLQRFARQMSNYWSNKYAQAIYAAFICTIIAMIDDDYIFRFPQMLIIYVLVYHIPSFAKYKS